MFKKSVLITSIITVAVFAVLTANSCKKDKPNCYDAALAAEYANMICLEHCPGGGVAGCDGDEYCNTCYAAKKGIRAQ